MASWSRPRSLRTGRSLRFRRESEDEIVQLDLQKELSVNVREVLSTVVKQDGISRGRKLGYLNAFIKLCDQIHAPHKDCYVEYGMSPVEIFCCLRVSLFHEAKEVRAAGLRAMRYLLNEETMIDAFLLIHGHHLVCRSLDIVLENQVEHVQALRLIRRVLCVCPSKFPPAFVKCLIAIANDGLQERERLLHVCLATLGELAILNTKLCGESGIVGSLLKSIVSCQLPRINEALVGTVLYLLNHPNTRQCIRMGIDLEQVLAPYTDCHDRSTNDNLDHSGEDKESMFAPSKMALLSILRSWPGMVRLCKPDACGIKSLIDILYLPNADVRKGVMELLFELFRIPVPEWTSNFPTALGIGDSMNLQDSWKLSEGFVSEEGCAILPHIAEFRMNLIENYLALLLLAFISNGLLEALVEVITTGDNFVSIRATSLLGELLHLANRLLPHECNHHSQCLPTLMALAASFEVPPQQRHNASAAVTYLNEMHSLKKRGPLPCSLFLDQLVHFSPKGKDFQSKSKVSRAKLLACLRKDADDFINQAIKDAQIANFGRDYQDWDWELIGSLLKMCGESLKKLEDGAHKLFLRKLVNFYKPTSKLFSRQELTATNAHTTAVVGCHLMDFLIEAEEGEASKFLEEFLTDFGLCLHQITTERAPLDAILCPNRILSTNSQHYFLFVGRLCHSSRGRKSLEKTNIYQYLLELVSVSTHHCYCKLIVSSLDYSIDGLPRVILSKILTGTSEPSRLYATHFMRILVRLLLPEFHGWGIDLLMSQLHDKAPAVSLAALDVLDEACESEANLEALENLHPTILHLGDRGLLLFIRFMSNPVGFKNLEDFAGHELKRWRKSYNVKYVRIVEDELNDSLTRHQRGKDGNYGRRTSQKHVIRDVFIPPHLYGQLVQHKAGLDLLRKQDCLVLLMLHIRQQKMDTDDDIAELKASLWALGHMGTSEEGIALLCNGHIIPDVVKLAEECPVYSIRGTCFFVLGLLATTCQGADRLSKLGWESLRHIRSETWPLVEEPNLLFTDDCLSSADSLSSQLGDLDHDDACSATLARLDEDDNDEGQLNSEYGMDTGQPKTRFMLGGFEEDNGPLSMESKRSWSPLTKEEEGVLRKGTHGFGDYASVAERPSIVASSPSARLSPSRVSYHRWSHTMPLMRNRPSTIVEAPAGDGEGAEDPCPTMSRQRSHSVTHRPTVARGVIEAWERRNRIAEGPGSSMHSSPQGSVRLRPNQKMTQGRERVRSKSFTEPAIPGGVSKHARSSSSTEMDYGRAAAIPGSVQSEYGDVHFHVVGFKERRSESNESSRTSTSKSRSNSCTDSTSGFSSGESGNVRPTTERPQLLSPIASSSSLNTMSGRTVHHSDPTRKLVNLRKTPVVLCRVSAPVNMFTSAQSTHNFASGPSLSPDFHSLETSFVYTTTRDAQGYATLRSLQQRRRGFSTCVPPDPKMVEYNMRAIKTRSLDSRLELPSMFTYDSLSSLGVSNFQRQHSLSHSLSTHLASAGREQSKFIGLCLPVDISMIFNEDGKDNRPHRDRASSPDFKDSDKMDPVVLRPHMDRDPLFNENLTDGLELHTCDSCIGCSQIGLPDCTCAAGGVANGPKVSHLRDDQSVSRANSSEVSAATTPGSVSSLCSNDPDHIDEDSLAGKALLRKEVLRFVVNLSSSVAIKSAEQGLLNLKQKFPNAFQDLCLYSEICHLMAAYRFRLSARRFIQELFMDLTFNELLEEPIRILGLRDVVESTA